jgi:hypothetical protein
VLLGEDVAQVPEQRPARDRRGGRRGDERLLRVGVDEVEAPRLARDGRDEAG